MDLKTFCEQCKIQAENGDQLAEIIAKEYTAEGRSGAVAARFLEDPNWRGSSWCGSDPSVGIFSGYYEEVETTDTWAGGTLDALRVMNTEAHTWILDNLLESVTNERLESR